MPEPTLSHDEAPTELGLTNDHEQEQEQCKDEVESNQSCSLSDGDKDEYIIINLSEVRKELECPICLGIIRKTRTVMECLHRFCRECIDKSMRLGNNECPVCRAHCASRRSLRDDPNYDDLISAFIPDIDKYEEEEMALHQDEVNHNKKIQASIAQTLQRQTEALGRKRNASARDVDFASTSQGNYRTSHLRRRINFENEGELQVSNDNEDMNDNDAGKNSSSSDEEEAETSPKGCGDRETQFPQEFATMDGDGTVDKKTETMPKEGGEGEIQFPQESATVDADGTGNENIPDVNREIISSGTLVRGENGHRSNTRVNSKNVGSNRLSRLIDHLRNSDVNDAELEIHLVLVSLDEQRIPTLQEPYLCCRPDLSVRILCKYVALKAGLLADEVELCLVEESKANIVAGEITVDPDKDKLCVLVGEETLAELYTRNSITCGHLLMGYRMK